jgi:hypothetical protein
VGCLFFERRDFPVLLQIRFLRHFSDILFRKRLLCLLRLSFYGGKRAFSLSGAKNREILVLLVDKPDGHH